MNASLNLIGKHYGFEVKKTGGQRSLVVARAPATERVISYESIVEGLKEVSKFFKAKGFDVDPDGDEDASLEIVKRYDNGFYVALNIGISGEDDGRDEVMTSDDAFSLVIGYGVYIDRTNHMPVSFKRGSTASDVKTKMIDAIRHCLKTMSDNYTPFAKGLIALKNI